MALFRRIQSSISKGESTATKKKNAGRFEEKSPTNSILEVLRHSRKQAKDPSAVREGKNVLTQKRSVPKDQKTQATHALAGVKVNQITVYFYKEVPNTISTSRENTVELNNEASEGKASSNTLELPTMEK